jgi:hypothetical protein
MRDKRHSAAFWAVLEVRGGVDRRVDGLQRFDM